MNVLEFISGAIFGFLALFAFVLVANHTADLIKHQIIKRNDVLRARSAAWQEGYDQGVSDERTSVETGPHELGFRYMPNRENPYVRKTVQ